MTAAWVTIALLVVGAPLVAWWLGGRRFWGRIESRSADDPAAAIMRRHGVSATEATRVFSAVTGGRELEDPRQRAAAAELAQHMLEVQFPRWEDASVSRRVMLVFTVVWVGGVVTFAVFRLALGGPGDVSWFNVLWVVLMVGPPLWQSYRLRRAIVLNSDVADPPREH